MSVHAGHPLRELLREQMIAAGHNLYSVPFDGGESIYLDNCLPVSIIRVRPLVNHMSMSRLPAGHHKYMQVHVMADMRVLEVKAAMKSPILTGLVVLGLDETGDIGFSDFRVDHLSVQAAAKNAKSTAIADNRVHRGPVSETVDIVNNAFKPLQASVLSAIMNRLKLAIAAHAGADSVLAENTRVLLERSQDDSSGNVHWPEGLMRDANRAARDVQANIDEQCTLTEILYLLSPRHAAMQGILHDDVTAKAENAARLVEQREQSIVRRAEMNVMLEQRRDASLARELAQKALEARVQKAVPSMLAFLRELASATDTDTSAGALALLEEYGLVEHAKD